MKKTFKTICALILCAAAFACTDQLQDDTVKSVIIADVTSINEVAANNPAEFPVSITSNVNWIVETPSWVTPSQSFGSGDAIITFRFESNYKNETTTTKPRSGEIKISGGGILNGNGAVLTIPVEQLGFTYIDPSAPIGGIASADEFVDFCKAVSAGTGTKRWQNDEGHVVLLEDIDLSGVKEWIPAGSVQACGTPAYEGNAFSGVFDGQGHKITGISWTYDVTDTETHAIGLFGAIDDAVVKNLVIGAEGDQITIVGSSQKVIAVGALAGHIKNSTISGITNYVNVVLADKDAAVPGDNPAVLMMLGGIAGTITSPMVFGTQAEPIKNYGEVKTGKITNTGNGGSGMTVGGIVAFTVAVDGAELKMTHCYNYGGVSAPTGRGGGLVGTLGGATAATALTTISNCENHGLIQDDVVGQYKGETGNHNLKRMGGLVGGTVTNNAGAVIDGCTNYGNVFSQLGCRTGGFIGHNQATIKNCVNKGVILAKNSDSKAEHGAGWACGFNGKKELITGCVKGGRVGDYDTYKDNPNAAPEASDDNACAYKNSERYDPSANN